MNRVFGIAGILRRYHRRVEDSAYLVYIRKFPCVSCGLARRIEAAHIGPHGISRKTDDCTALPLCSICHREGPGALHQVGPAEFQKACGLDFAALQVMFNRFFVLKYGRSAAGWEREQERRRAA